MQPTLRLGTRGSRLAMWQSRYVMSRLVDSGRQVELVVIKTEGDRDQTAALANIGGQGVFTKGLQEALLENRIDLAVHSLKDLPTIEVPRLQVSAVPVREDPRDVLIAREADSLTALRAGAAIGTGSIRRRAQLLYLRGDLEMQEIRGNVETRIRKLIDGNFDAIVLANAGLKRLELTHHISQYFESDEIYPAVGQGALGIETRADDPDVIEAVSVLNDSDSFRCVMAERQMLRSLQGGCLAPIGAATSIQGETLTISGVVLPADGSTRIETKLSGPAAEFESLGRRAARSLLDSGAAEYLQM